MLDDDCGRPVEAAHEPPCRLGVVHVEIAHRLATVLHGLVPPARRSGKAIASALLMGVLAVAQHFRAFELERHGRRQRRREVEIRGSGGYSVGVEPLDDGPVVLCRASERIAGKPLTGRR